MKSYDHLYIGGEFVEPSTGESFESVDPYTGEAWARLPRGSSADVARAVEAAHDAAFRGEWSRLSATERGTYLLDLADALDEHAHELAELEVRDNGKILRGMYGQHESIPNWYRYYGGLADKVQGETLPADRADMEIITRKEPVGVIAAITPWNSPLLLASWKLGPALAAGNGVVLKPDEHTSTSALRFAEIVDEVGFPAGAVNVVTGFGDEVGQALVEHDLVDHVSFTGGTETGAHVAGSAGENLKSTTMELGGKSPHIVFADADLEGAMEEAIAGIFNACGQSCSAGSRLLVQEEIYDDVVDELAERAGELSIGDPKDPETDMGPLASAEHFERVKRYFELGKEEGATLVCGGVPEEGEFESDLVFLPTVFADVKNEYRIAQEEIFGPILSVIRFDDEDEAIEIANDTRYGLAAGVWTEDYRKALRVADRVRAGRFWVNAYRHSSFLSPQGGYKDSGWGVENGVEAINECLKTKAVWISTS